MRGSTLGVNGTGVGNESVFWVTFDSTPVGDASRSDPIDLNLLER